MQFSTAWKSLKVTTTYLTIKKILTAGKNNNQKNNNKQKHIITRNVRGWINYDGIDILILFKNIQCPLNV
jgi:hypothetical protein